MEPDWANLDSLPLSLVLDKLEERIDYIWFGAVCNRWRSIAKLNHQNHQFRTKNVPPMLMIPTTAERRKIKEVSLYGIVSRRMYPFQLSHSLNKCCRGFSHGWFALVNPNNAIITLVNPFKYIASITLPPLESVYKVTLSADPITSPNDYVVAAICNKYDCLAYIRAGQTFWTFTDTNYSCFVDVIFYKGLVFAVNERNMIVSFNPCYLEEDDPFYNEKITSHIVPEESLDETYIKQLYLVKSLTGDLWIVRRCLNFRHSERISRFDVYKLEIDAQRGKIQQILKLENFEDNILFMGGGDSISVSASYYSKSFEKGSIYFADAFGIYNLKEDGKLGCLYPLCLEWMPLLFWVIPHCQWD